MHKCALHYTTLHYTDTCSARLFACPYVRKTLGMFTIKNMQATYSFFIKIFFSDEIFRKARSHMGGRKGRSSCSRAM